MGNNNTSVSDASDHCLLPALSFLGIKGEYIFYFEDNLDELKNALEDLKAKRDDVFIRVDDEELKGGRRVPEVAKWLSEIQTIEVNTDDTVAEASAVQQRLSAYGCCSNNIISTYRCGESVFKKLSEIKILLSTGYFEVVAEQPELPNLDFLAPKLNMEEYLHNLEKNLEALEKELQDLNGMRNELLKKVLKEEGRGLQVLLEVKGWISKVGVIEPKASCLLDKSISERHEFSKYEDCSQISKSTHHYREMVCKTLEEVKSLKYNGVFELVVDRAHLLHVKKMQPLHSNFSLKRLLDDTKLETKCLNPEEAWDFFQEVVGETTLTSNPDIPQLAKIVARRCGGLPIALYLIGVTMSSKRTAREWRHVIHVLVSSTAELSKMEGEFLPILKISYDSLPGENIRPGFLYCALFPKDDDIGKQELVDCWICEGIIEEEDREISEIKGYEMISDLIRMGLLMDNEYGYGVKMHGMVREMALWIASDFGMQKENFVVVGGAGIHQMPEVNDWRIVTRMSVTSTQIENISVSPNCSNLTTLFLQGNKNLRWISGDFFRWMKSLVVLNLSSKREFAKLPEEFSLPQEISELVSLRYLNLSGTSIKNLPSGLRNLRKLIHLDLEATFNLQSISLVSGLLKLQVFKFYGSKASLDLSLLKQLECLEDLELLTITVREVDVLKAFLGSKRAECTEGLYLEGLEVSGVSFAATFGVLGSLRNLKMINCDMIESDWEVKRRYQYSPSTASNQITPINTWFKNLSSVELLACKGLKDLTWLIYAANLESLSITFSPSLEEIFSEKKGAGVGIEPFQKLQVLSLKYLHNLKSIYWSSLSFPRLKKVDIKKCPRLRKLPLNFKSVENINDLRIEVEGKWLEEVEWEIGAKDRFLPVILTASVFLLHEIQKYISSVPISNVDDEHSSRHEIKASSSIQIVMAGLEDELRNILPSQWSTIEPDSLLLDSSASSSTSGTELDEDNSVSVVGEGNEEEELDLVLLDGSGSNRLSSRRNSCKFMSSICEIDLISSEAVSDLRLIVRWMVGAGYSLECVKVYGNLRKSAMETFFKKLGIEELGIGEVQKHDWEVVDVKIRRWIRAAKVCVRVVLASEKRLCMQIFDGVDTTATAMDETCFMEIVKSSALQLFTFPEAISISKRSPEKIFKILDLHDALTDLLPDLEEIFNSNLSEAILLRAAETRSRLAEAVRGILTEFENAVSCDPSVNPVPGGTIHPLTRYVMNYLNHISVYKQTLIDIIISKPCPGLKYTNDPNKPDMDLTELGERSPLALHVIWTIVMLQFNLEEKSLHYKDESLSGIFILNNVHYIVQKVRGSPELSEMVGDIYLRKLTGKFRHAATKYQKATWVRVLDNLKFEEPSGFLSDAFINALKENLKAFNTMFEEVHRIQSTWSVPDTQLREELRISCSDHLIPAYRTFLGRNKGNIERRGHPENYFKYNVQDLETAVLDFFEGYTTAPQLRRRSQ